MASGEGARSAEISAARRISSLSSPKRVLGDFDTLVALRGCNFGATTFRHKSCIWGSCAPKTSSVSCMYKMSFARSSRSRFPWIKIFWDRKLTGLAMRILAPDPLGSRLIHQG
jgi:hypothetical protein